MFKILRNTIALALCCAERKVVHREASLSKRRLERTRYPVQKTKEVVLIANFETNAKRAV